MVIKLKNVKRIFVSYCVVINYNNKFLIELLPEYSPLAEEL